MLFCRESSFFDFSDIIGEALLHDLSSIGEVFDEFRFKVGKESQHVLINQHLAVAARACADTDSRNRNALP